jgi:UDP-GlcNAc:undecaprenyl-phosphate GlcNAc-1-phosphate transferase
MGDAGSLYLGLVLGALALALFGRAEGAAGPWLVAPVAALAAPIFDTTLVTIARPLHRRSPFQGGRDHTTHRLVRLGLSTRHAVLTLYAAAILLAALGLWADTLPALGRAAVALGMVLGLGAIGAGLMRVPVYVDDKLKATGGQMGAGSEAGD